ncbi:MAG: hypothetical protein JNK82_22005 [Myxococcaceae bacterium]|nr:hypothetical protein [Myxococcaceae bacterium]
MSRNVMGTLFVDYVRMLRTRKDVDWAKYFGPQDLPYLTARITPDGWYPMSTFERMGLAILEVIAQGELETVKAFGAASVDWLAETHPTLLAKGDPRESIMRFQVLRQSFFDFSALEVLGVSDSDAQLQIAYQMGPVAEEAASFQTMGFFIRLLELSGAKSVESKFTGRSWAGDPATVCELVWE